MIEAEIWLTIVCKTDHRYEMMCTLLAYHQLQALPKKDETLSFMPEKDTRLAFTQSSRAGPTRQTIVEVPVRSVRHYATRHEGHVRFHTAIICEDFPVFSEDDAQVVCNFLTAQFGFQVDPYGTNNLPGAKSDD